MCHFFNFHSITIDRSIDVSIYRLIDYFFVSILLPKSINDYHCFFWSDRPSCTIYESRTGKENQDVVLICEITFANPSNGLEFFWSLNGTELNQTFIDELSHQDGMKSKIIIPAYEEQLFGTWTCSARNTVGQTDPNCTLFVDAPIGMKVFLFNSLIHSLLFITHTHLRMGNLLHSFHC